jgi:glycosyltransferase involved in cell wall biosynthesis
MKRSPGVSIVIPVYRSADTLVKLVERLAPIVNSLPEGSEVILVNDGSPDASWEVICKLKQEHAFIRGINLMRNYGQHNALLAGIKTADGETIITMDDDLQNPPEEIPTLLRELSGGLDVVYGARAKEQNGPARNFASRLIKYFVCVTMRVPIATSITSFRAFRAHLVEGFYFHQGPCVFIDALLCWGTRKIGSVTVSHLEREQGASNYSLGKLIAHTLNLITSFSTVPLQLASLLGFFTTCIGLFFFIFVIIAYFFLDKRVPGFTFLAAALTLFSGVQLFVLGIMGEYLARMHARLTGSPAYQIRETI